MRTLAMSVLAAGLLAAGCGAPGGGPGAGGSADDFQPPSLAGTGLSHYWQAPLPIDPGETIERLYHLDEKIYLLTSDRDLIAVDARTGLAQWVYRIGYELEEIFDPCHPIEQVSLPVDTPDGREVKFFDAVMINTVSRLIILDRSDGTEIRDLSFRTFTANAGGSADAKHFYVGSVSGLYYAFDYGMRVPSWRLKTEEMISAPTVVDGKYVYVGSEDGHLYASEVSLRPEKVWIHEMGGAVVSRFIVNRTGCFVPCMDGRVYGLDFATGESIWEAPYAYEKPMVGPILVGENSLFQRSEDGKLHVLDMRTGRLLWTQPDVQKVLANMDELVYTLAPGPELRVYSEDLGEEEIAVPLDGLELFLANSTVPAIYAVGGRKLHCIRPESAERLTPEMLEN